MSKLRNSADQASGAGTLYVVATPIGNLEDITLRAIRILKEVDLIAAEDTRHTKKLLNHYSIATSTLSYYKEKEQSRSDIIIAKLLAGQNIALVSDAGTPGISDPGTILIQKAVAQHIKITPIPGPSSLTTMLSVAGLTDGSFVFLGFPPSRKKQRLDVLHSLVTENRPLVFFEAPHRLENFLYDCFEVFGDRPVVWGRELTKIHEELLHTTLENIANTIKNKKTKGESVIIISGAEKEPPLTEREIKDILQSYRSSGELSLKNSVERISKTYNLSRTRVYRLALDIWK